MRYTAMIVGFLFATLTAVGAAEPDRSNGAELGLNDLVKSDTIYKAVSGCAHTIETGANIAD